VQPRKHGACWPSPGLVLGRAGLLSIWHEEKDSSRSRNSAVEERKDGMLGSPVPLPLVGRRSSDSTVAAPGCVSGFRCSMDGFRWVAEAAFVAQSERETVFCPSGRRKMGSVGQNGGRNSVTVQSPGCFRSRQSCRRCKSKSLGWGFSLQYGTRERAMTLMPCCTNTVTVQGEVAPAATLSQKHRC
jgi:hypothetical protein